MPYLSFVLVFALRVVLNIQGWTPPNSDESIMNLMALHIAYRGEHPTFFLWAGLSRRPLKHMLAQYSFAFSDLPF